MADRIRAHGWSARTASGRAAVGRVAVSSPSPAPAAWLLALLALSLLLSAVMAIPALAQDDAPELGLRGSLLYESEEGGRIGAEGVVITVTGPDGAVVGEATTDVDGVWTVPVDSPGEYTATIVPETLPEGVTLSNPDASSVTRDVEDSVQFAIFNIQSGAGVAGNSGVGRQALQLFVEGINLGLMIAMMAIGLSLVFGTTGLVNFAHGEVVTLGAFLAWVFNVTLGMHLIWAALLAILATAIVSGLFDLAIFRPLRRRGVGLISQLVITIGLSLMLRFGIQYVFGGGRKSYAQYGVQAGDQYGPIVLAPKTIVTFVLSVVVLLAIGLFLQRTQMGRAMRAVSDNRDLAESSGIDVQRVILIVWAVGGALAALGGILWALNEALNYLVGFRLLLPIFAGMILGGIGTAYGALVGSLVIGVFIQMSTLVIPSELKTAAALAVLVVVLVVRPQGIMGRSERVG